MFRKRAPWLRIYAELRQETSQKRTLHSKYRHVGLEDPAQLRQSCACFVKGLNRELPKESQLDVDIDLPKKTPSYHKHLMLISPPNKAGSDPEWKGSWQAKLEMNPEWPYSAIAEVKNHLKETKRGEGILINAISVMRGKLLNSPSSEKKAQFLALPDMKVYEVSQSELKDFAYFVGEGMVQQPRGRAMAFADYLKGADAISKELEHREVLNTRKPGMKDFTTKSYQNNLILVCGHHQRDERCGLIAPKLIKELEAKVEQSVDLAIVSHIGGHKFAGNVIFYKFLGFEDSGKATVDSLWFGKILPSAVPILLEHLKKNEIVTSWFRGGCLLES
ncbi:LAQU0S03e01288g1_1 [Lachancea quebecensis]|uniref:Altered inheritance of mitochondria protein 32 n=1 Tax=Lachancea quebecensis TaxID=1654605 RepID=A0A0P1KR81_9SACH|nr:LAQU0S03e01288g1_1 [Lachancea quebecensis]